MKIEKIQEIFTANPKAKKVFVSTDDMPFLKENTANNHQANLNRKSKKTDKLKVYSAKEVTAEIAEIKKAAEAKAKKD